MAFDKPTRKRLSDFVSDARGVIADEFTEQFQSLYGISAKGEIAPLDKLGHLDEAGLATAALLRERIDYLEKTHPDDKDGTRAAVARLAREQAFTILNRLAAIRMAEKRGLIVESVGQGYQSKGFKVFETVAGSALGDTYHRYRRYLFCLFDELAIDLGVLFDRRSPQALLFPREPALLALLDLLHAADLEPLWAEDETIGWIYQYYNDPEERKKMRKESAAPRNSRELAVRNQFFTPRYVVEFLTDNTLGRIWYEMTRGQTRLAEQCRYLVRRPTEIFLAEGETAPETPDQEGLSQEELLKQPVHIPHRPLKDPREIRLLDPACGSMHFGLYAFDLFETIYEEAWDNGSCPALQEAYASRDEFLQDIPRLIIEHNIHGIDIDPRAVQIAGLSLWLRAQKAWQARGVKPADRPRVRRSNIVCAEPMPGSPEMLEEFVATLKPDLLGELVKTVFDKMQLAGEAGSLLKIEEEIRTAIDTARKEWLKQQDDLLTRKDGSQEEFFDTAEQQVIETLRAYAEQADADSYQRRLFADDAARGFAFIDLCRKRYDAVVMNPPFGDSPAKVKAYLKKYYGFGRPDAYMCFVFRSKEILVRGGRTGAITSRTFLTLQFFEYLRDLLLEGSLRLDELIDLGSGVLDGATVETCAYCSEKSELSASPIFFNLEDHRAVMSLADEIENLSGGKVGKTIFPTPRHEIAAIPGRVFAYRMVPSVRRAFAHFPPLDDEFAMEVRSPRSEGNHSANVRQGLIPGDQFRFSRLATEVPIQASGWKWAAKGGDYAKFVSLDDLMIKWHNDGKEIKMYAEINYGGASRTIKNEQYFFRRGISFPRVSSVGLNARALPEGSVFTDTGMAVIVEDPTVRLSVLGFLNSRLADYCCDSLHPGRKFEIAHVSSLPLPPDLLADLPFRQNVERAMSLVWRIHSADEDLPLFLLPTLPESLGLPDHSGSFSPSVPSVAHELASLQESINREVFRIFGIPEKDQADISDALYQETGGRLPAVTNIYLNPELSFDDQFTDDESSDVANLISYFLGASIGRWDICYATGERKPPELPDPFDPLPVCPPGMLQNAKGLPAEPKDVPADYPLRISWHGILVDDENHPEDIVARVGEAIEVIWKDRAEAIEQEACGILGVKTLRDYFRRPAAFFADHLKRYSKSRRQAPIYWPLSTKTGSYTLWLYYHRLTDQTLHTCLADFLDPKLRKVQSELDALTASGGGGTRAGDLREFLDELHDLRDEIERVIKLPWKPNLNDGVLITASPLHKLFRLPKWQKDLKACWDKLAKGDYDWAHLAYTIWPGRVEKACETDRSIAIAHGREDLCKVEPPKPKKKRRKK